MPATDAPLRFHLYSLVTGSGGQFQPVGIKPDGNDSTLPVSLGYESVWESTFKQGPCRGQFYLTITPTSPYSVVTDTTKTKVIAIKPLDPNFFWFSTTRGKIPGKDQWAATYELQSDSNQVWTVADPTNPNSEIVLKAIDYVEPGKISTAQLFTLSVINT